MNLDAEDDSQLQDTIDSYSITVTGKCISLVATIAIELSYAACKIIT